ncbi:MAG: LCP family protein [Oscillospiraceae bacterium]
MLFHSDLSMECMGIAMNDMDDKALDRIISEAMQKKQQADDADTAAGEQILHGDTNPPRGGKRRKKSWTKRRVIITVLVSVLAAVFVVSGVALALVWQKVGKINYVPSTFDNSILDSIPDDDTDSNAINSDQSDIDKADQDLIDNLKNHAQELTFSDNVYNILLVGTDARSKTERGRSDSMILVSINKETKEITLTSFMRDLYVAIPGKQNNRINAAYAFGGPAMLISTIQNNFGIRIDRFAQVNFYSFMDVIDEIGGVQITVTDAEVAVMNNYIQEQNKLEGDPLDTDKLSGGGTYNLTGKQALGYCRIRYVGNADYQRTQRQRDVLMKVIEKAKGMSVSELSDFVDVFFPQITTDMTQGEVFGMILKAPTYLSYDINQLRIPLNNSYRSMTIRDMSVLVPDFAANTAALKKELYGE